MGRVLKTAGNDIAAKFLLEDVPGATIPASRLNSILEKVFAQKPLTVFQEDFLRRNGHLALTELSQGLVTYEEFRNRAAQEREIRAAKNEQDAKRAAAEDARRAEISERKNAILFAAKERKSERKNKLRALPDLFGLPFIHKSDLNRVNRILGSVVAGCPVGKDDLLWLAAGEGEYWTVALRKAHHKIMAETLQKDWTQTADAWCAVNACGHWRKADCPTEGFAIVQAALVKAVDPKVRSALYTTGGGALRDLRQFAEAVSFGNEAHALNTANFRPCTLLGAVHIEMGAYPEGAAWYEKAEARGASRTAIDRELQSILLAAPKEDRLQMKNALRALGFPV